MMLDYIDSGDFMIRDIMTFHFNECGHFICDYTDYGLKLYNQLELDISEGKYQFSCDICENNLIFVENDLECLHCKTNSKMNSQI